MASASGPIDHESRRARTSLWVPITTLALMAAGFGSEPARDDRAPDSTAGGLDPRRGRFADSPAEIQPRGWKDILVRVRDGISDDRVIAIAAGITFYALLAIFPALAAFVALYGIFAAGAGITAHLQTVAGFVPAGGIAIIEEQLQRIVAQGNNTLGFAFFLGLIVSLWSANSGTKALFDALNVVYSEKEKRSFLKLNALSLLFTFGGILMLLTSIAALIVLPILLEYIGLAHIVEMTARLARWPVLFGVLAIALAVLYRYGPDREKAKWRWITWGSTFAALAWIAVSILFSWYVTNFGSYNETYGSLGAVIGFMTWIWLSAIVILVGAELDAEMEHQTARDTTTGAPKPLGRRGAHMADTVGRAHS
jgi:membrane protein